MDEIIVTILILIVGAGIPALLAHKLKLNAFIVALIYIGLTFWVVPEFSFLSIITYLGFLIIMAAIGTVKIENEKVAAMSDDERKNYLTQKEKELEEQKRTEADKKTVRCPNCNSIEVNYMGNKRKSFSVGKAVGGTLLAGGIGSLAGFAGKKGKKDNWHCTNCGYTFERKNK